MEPTAFQSPESHPEWFTNRELSWLEFNRRVLEEAQDASNPLLERVKFLAIVDSNLAEFFEVRFAGLRQQAEAGVTERNPDGLSPAEQLDEIGRVVRAMTAELYRCWNDEIMPSLEKEGAADRAARPAPEEGCGVAGGALRDRDLPGPDAHRRGSRASLPAHPEQEPDDRGAPRHRGSPGALPARRGPGAARAAAHHPAPRSARPSGVRLPARRHPLAAPAAVPGRSDPRSHGLPRHAKQQSLRGRGGDREPAHGGRAGAAPAQARRGRAARGPQAHRAPARERAARRLRARAGRSLRNRRPGEPLAPPRARLAGGAGTPEGQHVRAPGAPRAPGSRELPARDPPQRPAAPSSLRFLRERGRFRRHRGARPERPRHQADALPHERGLAHRALAAGRRRARQAGDGGRGADGALRRGGEHPLGAPHGRGRRPDRVRPRRPQDPLQAAAGGAARGERRPPLRAHRNRQLQPRHRASVHRPGPAHGRSGHDGGSGRRVQHAHQPVRARRVRTPPGVAVHRAQRRRWSASSGRSSTCAPGGRPR